MGFRSGSNDYSLLWKVLAVRVPQTSIGEDPCIPWNPTIVTLRECDCTSRSQNVSSFKMSVGRVLEELLWSIVHIVVSMYLSVAGVTAALGWKWPWLFILVIVVWFFRYSTASLTTMPTLHPQLPRVINPAMDSFSFHLSWVAPGPQDTAVHLALVLLPDQFRRAPRAGKGLPPLLHVLWGKHIWSMAMFVSKFTHSLTQLSKLVFKAITHSQYNFNSGLLQVMPAARRPWVEQAWEEGLWCRRDRQGRWWGPAMGTQLLPSLCIVRMYFVYLLLTWDCIVGQFYNFLVPSGKSLVHNKSFGLISILKVLSEIS